jgi:hypothetical protein
MFDLRVSLLSGWVLEQFKVGLSELQVLRAVKSRSNGFQHNDGNYKALQWSEHWMPSHSPAVIISFLDSVS